MITLYGFGRAFGMPDPSQFVIKAEVLLKMSGLPFETKAGDMRKAPKGKLPYIVDNGVEIADSTLIRFHLETKHGVNFDGALSSAERGAAWAFEKLCEDHLYWVIVKSRWMNEANYNAGPAVFFAKIPALIRPFIVGIIHKKVKRNLFGQGFGRFSPEEGKAISARALRSIAAYLEHRDFIGGAEPCGSDASVFACLLSILCPIFTSDERDEAEKHPVLAAYVERMKARYYPA